ncbi:uncharacterized protein [Pseudochaenichthys georgianus]|uniref:uncharacterized protein isoform X1 n=1 Tax=Pseudochaenichthys georgianus TaxID=52239 RepID=UPI00146F67CD|nr:uncharacterized protein LOC117449744 isoform X1 [Pseudochaenichthys georgianus]
MDVCHRLTFFVLTLQGPNTGLVSAGGHPVFTGTEGGNISVHCSFVFPGRRKLLCKPDCEERILIETTGDKATQGRYRIEYIKTIFLSYRVRVGITKLTKSDSGRYKCILDRYLLPNSHGLIEIIVEDAPTTSKPKWTLQPFSTEVQSASTPPTPQKQSSSLRSFTSSSSSPETPTHQQQTEGTAAPASGGPLYVGLIVLAKIMLSLAGLFFCWRRARKHKELPVEAEYASVSKTNKPTQRSPAVEIPSVHAYAKYTKPKDDKSSDDYSLVGPVGTTAARSQHKAEDDSSELVYSELRFPVVTASSLNASSRANDVIYSMIQVEAKPKEY